MFRFAKMEIWRALPGPTLYSSGWLWLGLWSFCYLRWFRAISSLVRVRCWFWTFRLTAVSVYLIIGSALVLVSDVPIGGGFVSIMLVCVRCWFCAFLFLGGGFVSIMVASVIWHWVAKKASIFNCAPTAHSIFR